MYQIQKKIIIKKKNNNLTFDWYVTVKYFCNPFKESPEIAKMRECTEAGEVKCKQMRFLH